jgi:hypothetical protein
MEKKGRRLIANYLMRYYTANTHSRLKAWKLMVNLRKQQEKVLMFTIRHWNYFKFYQSKNALQMNASLDQQTKIKKKIKKVFIE